MDKKPEHTKTNPPPSQKQENISMPSCGACGDTRTILTEDVGSHPRCAGCGRNK